MKSDRTLTPAELYSLELRARRARGQTLGRLLRNAVRATKAVIERAISHIGAKGIRHA